MNFSRSYQIKAAVCDLDQIVVLAEYIINLYKKEGNSYNKPDFKITKSNEETITTQTIVDFKNNLKSIKNVKDLSLSYWGKELRIDIRSYDFSNNIHIDVTSEKEEIYLLILKKIEETFKDKSFNSYAMAIFYIFYTSLYFVLLIVIAKKYKLDIDILTLIIYLCAIPPIFLGPWFVSLYPGLVIINANNKSGRIIKKDIFFLILTFLIPILFKLF